MMTARAYAQGLCDPIAYGILNTLKVKSGPYRVIRQNNNGSILIEKSPTDTQNVNIRHIAPYYENMETPNN